MSVTTGADEREPEKASKPFWAKCGTCNHCWAVAYYPLEAGLFARIVRGHCQCPRCGEKKSVFVAKQDDGVLQEQTA